MFFYIGDVSPIKSLSNVANRLFLDKGWQQKDNVWYKGYSTECILEERLYDIIDGYQPNGKWCVIHNESVYHPILRGFPLYSKNNNLTNLAVDGFDTVYYNKPDVPINSTVTLDEASKIIGDILLENVVNFYKFNDVDRLNILTSCGLDTTTVWAVTDFYTKNYTLTAYVPKKNDTTLPKILGRVREYDSDLIDFASTKHWGYNISSIFSNVNWYLTGYYGGTVHFRDAEAINALANYQDKKVYELAKEHEYLFWFLKRPKVMAQYNESIKKYHNQESLKDFLYSTIFYDHQMWHLDNNMIFSPFFDIRIPHTMLRLSIEDITANCTTGVIQRNIINRFNPQLLLLVSDYKNEKDVWANFKKNWTKIKLDPMTKIIIR
jgi:hypothetical protein